MPERPPNRYDRQRCLSDAHAAGQYVKVKCVTCYGPARHYFPADLIRLIGDVAIVPEERHALREVRREGVPERIRCRTRDE